MASLVDGPTGQEEDRAGGEQTSDFAWALEGHTAAFKKALNPTFDPYRSDEGDENLSPNSQFVRGTTPETGEVSDDVVGLPPGSWNKPYSPRSNPFGERPSQRTPGARSFIRRLSTHSSLSGGLVTNVMADTGGREEENVWLFTPEVSLQEVKSSWDAVGRIERLLDDQAKTDAGLDGSSLQPADMALTWTGTQISTQPAAEDGASWRQRVANTAFHGTPSPTSSRASSLSGGEALGSAGAQRRRSAPGASPLVQGTPQAVPEESGTPDSQNAETFPRSFRIQRSGSADSLASLLSHTSDITSRELGSSFERERDALRECKMETILEPGETPLRTADGNAPDARSRFARATDAAPVLATPRQEPGGAAADEAGSPSSTRSKQWLARTASQKWLEGHGTPRSASGVTLPVQKAEGAFASPIEVQETAEFTLPPPSAKAQALPPPVAKEALTPFVRLNEPARLTPVINAAHNLHAKGGRAKAAGTAGTPFARLRQPMPLTPVIQGPTRRHAQAATPSGDSSRWMSLIQLLLVLATLAALLLLPALIALVPNFNGHILPSAPFKARHQTSSAALFPHGHPLTHAQKLLWKPAKEQSRSFSESASKMLSGIWHHDGHGASFGLLGKPSPPPPTPHLDRLLGMASAQWAQATAWLHPAVIDRPLSSGFKRLRSAFTDLPRLVKGLPEPVAKASNVIQKATAAGEAFMHKVVHTMLPDAEPAHNAASRAALMPKTQATPASTPTTTAQTISADQKQVTHGGEFAAEQAHQATEAVKKGTDTAVHRAGAALKQVGAAAQSKARDASAISSKALQRAKSGAEERLGLISGQLSEVARKAGSTVAEQTRQAAVPIQAGALRARFAAASSAQRSAAFMRSVIDSAKQGASDHPQGIMAAAAITLLLGILAGLLAVTVWPDQAEEVEREEADGLGSCSAPMETPVLLFTPRPVRLSRLGAAQAPMSLRSAVSQRAAAAMSMPATTPRPARSSARAAWTAPVSSSKAIDITSTADTPAARTRSRARRAA